MGIAIILSITALIIVGIIAFTTYKCAIQEDRVKVQKLEEKLFSKGELLLHKEQECQRLALILKEVFEKTSKVSVDAQIKS
jgi:Tfp pilus assembly protein PilX